MNTKTNLYDLRINNIIENYSALILNTPNIVGIGYGNKIINGFRTKIPTATFLVKRKLPKDTLSSSALIPQWFHGSPTDVIEVGEFSQQSSNTVNSTAPFYYPLSARQRPCPAGVSIGIGTDSMPSGVSTNGTLGYFVTDRKAQFIYILSCAHILSSTPSLTSYNQTILQPSISNGGNFEKDKIATLEKFAPIDISDDIKKQLKNNQVNAAIALVGKNQFSGENSLQSIVKTKFADDSYLSPNIINDIKLGESVSKSGASTGKTYGTVKCINTTTKVNIFGMDISFKNQTIAEIKHLPGDDGSIGTARYNQKNPKEQNAFGMAIGSFEPSKPSIGASLPHVVFSDLSKILTILDVKLI